MKRLFPLLFLLVPACSFDPSTPALFDGGASLIDAATDPDAEVAEVFGFSSDFEEWRVPDTGTALGAFAATLNQNWALLDLDGDKIPEFVQTRDPSTNRAWGDLGGQQHWRVYSSGTAGFDAPFQQLLLPEGRDSRGFFATDLQGVWETMDLNGDGHLDLVHLVDPSTNELWTTGGRSWRVFLGSNLSLGTESFWPLPDIGTNTLKRTSHLSSSGYWSTTDLTDDGIPDLVHSAEPPLDVFDPETPNWHVYEGSGTGFGMSYVTWSLPQNSNSRGFFATDFDKRWSTLDLDLDGAVELVQFRQAVVPFTGPFYDGTDPIWKVFKKSGAGFDATATEWTLPTGVVPFDALAIAAGTLRWDVVDIDADGKLDLVHTANASADSPSVWGSPNSDQWKVYLGIGSGFSPTATPWPIPDSGTEAGFYALREFNGANNQWVTVDLDGDGQVELVQTADPSTGSVWVDGDGNPFWRVFRRRSE